MKNLLFSLLICLIGTIGWTQPQMTIWKLDSEHHDHDHEDSIDPPELYPCGSYFFFYSEEPITSNWSLKNEGDEDLILQLPLELSIPDQQRITITEQPSSSVVPPGQEVFFKVRYENIGVHQNVFLPIYSNDVETSGCGFLIGGNVLALCQCQCNGGIQESINCEDMECTTETIGLILSNGPCPMEGADCDAISISDPCGCDNTITVDGQLLFRDTLLVDALPGIQVNLSQNNADGMVDETNTPLQNGISLGQIPASGVLKFVFYRRPGTVVDVIVNGEAFMSAAPCPDAESCRAIPTLSEWGTIVLFLLFSIFGLAFFRKLNHSSSELA